MSASPFTVCIDDDDNIELTWRHGDTPSFNDRPKFTLSRDEARMFHTDLGEALGRFVVPELPAA